MQRCKRVNVNTEKANTMEVRPARRMKGNSAEISILKPRYTAFWFMKVHLLLAFIVVLSFFWWQNVGYLFSYFLLKIDRCLSKQIILKQRAFDFRGNLIALDKKWYPHNIFSFLNNNNNNNNNNKHMLFFFCFFFFFCLFFVLFLFLFFFWLPQQGTSNKYHNICLCEKNRKNSQTYGWQTGYILSYASS